MDAAPTRPLRRLRLPSPRRFSGDALTTSPRALLLAGAVATVAFTALAVFVHPLLAIALLAAAAVTPLLLRSVDLAFAAVLAIITLLPFAAIPLGIGFNPTFLDLTMGLLYLIWAVRLATREQTSLRIPPLGAAAIGFIGLMFVAFLAG
ncbi:MAG: hypothetical protein ABI780_15070, partial [Ardenticatenales bacterium]